MKTTKPTIMMVIAVLMMTGLSFAGESATSMAQKELHQSITECFNKNLRVHENFFYENGINKLKEEVQISFVVNKDQSLSLIWVNSDIEVAKSYVNHVFKTRKIYANQILVGKCYKFNLYLDYLAH
jgi:hypothetical protein